MDDRTARRYQVKAEMFKALAHPVRMQLLDQLRKRTWCVCELAAEVGIDKSVASKYLAQLKLAGLIADEKHGTLVEYRLIAPCILDMADCAEKTIMENRRRQLEGILADSEG